MTERKIPIESIPMGRYIGTLPRDGKGSPSIFIPPIYDEANDD